MKRRFIHTCFLSVPFVDSLVEKGEENMWIVLRFPHTSTFGFPRIVHISILSHARTDRQ